MEKKLIKEYEAMLPQADTLESIVAKGKLEPLLIDAKLKLAGVKKDNFIKWKKDPEKFKFMHNPIMYEELMAVGYHPRQRELKGVINIKLPYGYGGTCPRCLGSMEYVRFYLNWNLDGDFTDMWEDQGLGSVHVYDPGAAHENELPLEYAVQKRIRLPGRLWEYLEKQCCVRRVRAILSWVTIPPAGQPNWPPFWGNVFETNIRFHR